MGSSVFCSYYFENQITQLRDAIAQSKLNEMCYNLKVKTASKSGSKAEYYPNTSSHFDQDHQPNSKLNQLIDSEIDNLGNTALLYAIETRQLNSFKFLLLELNADPNRTNYYTSLTPLHVLAIAKYEPKYDQRDSKKSNTSNDSTKRTNISSQPSKIKLFFKSQF